MQQVYLTGLGALGIMFGQQLAQSLPLGNFKVVANTARQSRYIGQGIYCNGQPCHFTYYTPGENAPKADLLIFAVKFGGLASAIEDARPLVGENTVVLSLLNGISSEEILAEAYGQDKILYAVAQGMDATKTGNKLVYQNMGLICFGEKNGPPTPRVKTVAALLQNAGIAYQCPDDMQRRLWSKFMLNCGVNQVAMVRQTDYNGLQKTGPARQMMLDAMQEVMAISQKNGINLTRRDIDDWMVVLGKLSPDGMPSMRQDADARRKSEVELFAGTVCRLGRQYGVPTPVNTQIYQTVVQIEAAYLPEANA